MWCFGGSTNWFFSRFSSAHQGQSSFLQRWLDSDWVSFPLFGDEGPSTRKCSPIRWWWILASLYATVAWSLEPLPMLPCCYLFCWPIATGDPEVQGGADASECFPNEWGGDFQHVWCWCLSMVGPGQWGPGNGRFSSGNPRMDFLVCVCDSPWQSVQV